MDCATAASPSPDPGPRSTLSGEQGRPACSVGAGPHLRCEWDRTGSGLSGARRNVWSVECREGHAVRGAMARREGVLVRRSELSRSCSHPRQATRRTWLARLQRHAGSEGRAANRAVRHSELVRTTEVLARDTEWGSGTHFGLLRDADRRHDIFEGRRLHDRPRTMTRRSTSGCIGSGEDAGSGCLTPRRLLQSQPAAKRRHRAAASRRPRGCWLHEAVVRRRRGDAG